MPLIVTSAAYHLGQRPNTLLDSSKSVNTSPAATVYLCQRSSKLQDELFIQCAPWETRSYNTYHINKQWWTDSPMHKSSSTFLNCTIDVESHWIFFYLILL